MSHEQGDCDECGQPLDPLAANHSYPSDEIVHAGCCVVCAAHPQGGLLLEPAAEDPT